MKKGMYKMERTKIAVVGATGMVGQRLLVL